MVHYKIFKYWGGEGGKNKNNNTDKLNMVYNNYIYNVIIIVISHKN